MFSFVIVIHIVACAGLIFFILIQQGRGGGLIESFSSAESLFGTKTSSFLTKATTGLAITFFITCLLLAFISVQRSKSVVERHSIVQDEAAQATEEAVEEITEETKEESENEEPVKTENENNAAMEEIQPN